MAAVNSVIEQELRLLSFHIFADCNIDEKAVTNLSKKGYIEGIDWSLEKVIVGREGFEPENIRPELVPLDEIPEDLLEELMKVDAGSSKPVSIKEHLMRIGRVAKFCAENDIDMFDLISQKRATKKDVAVV